MTISHHPDDATLMSYAAGSLPEALAAVVASHLALCPACVREVRTLERVGVVLLEGLAGSPTGRALPEMALRGMEADIEGAHRDETSADADVPLPLQGLIGTRLDDVPWKRLGMGVWHLPMKLSRVGVGVGDLRLLRVAPGQAMPEHGHGGGELTLILRGSYRDELGIYRTGDVSDLGDDVEHRPIADQVEGCICLIASEKRARFKGLFGRIVQPLTGI